MHTPNVPGSFWDTVAKHERRHYEAAMNPQCRAMLARCAEVSRSVDEMILNGARAIVAIDALNRRGPLA
jgi:hypothetical protein